MNRIQKSLITLEIVGLMGAGGVLAFTSEPAAPPPPPPPTGSYSKPTVTTRIAVPTEAERQAFLDEYRVDINTADAQLIGMIDGIGEKTAENVVAFRETNGPFAAFEDLDRIPGIGEKTLESLRKGIRPLGDESYFDAPEGLVDINTANAKELQRIPGVGPSMAEDILEYRKQHGSFRSAEDLMNVEGIGEAKLDKFRSAIIVHSSTARIVDAAPKATDVKARTHVESKKPSGSKININTASVKQLTELSGVGEKTAENIVAYRKKHGRFNSISDLENVNGMGKKTIDKFRDQVVVD